MRVVAGYQADGKPYVQHYVMDRDNNMLPDTNGISYNEDFADMFMNWVETGQKLYNPHNGEIYRIGFSVDVAGNARYNWINQRMVGWIQEAIH
jgi:hypothetical protein